jgi:hypothetical protein
MENSQEGLTIVNHSLRHTGEHGFPYLPLFLGILDLRQRLAEHKRRTCRQRNASSLPSIPQSAAARPTSISTGEGQHTPCQGPGEVVELSSTSKSSTSIVAPPSRPADRSGQRRSIRKERARPSRVLAPPAWARRTIRTSGQLSCSSLVRFMISSSSVGRSSLPKGKLDCRLLTRAFG